MSRQEEHKLIGKQSKPLGRKKFTDLSDDAVKKTRTSYKETFVDKMNQYGENRGLVVEKLVLRDEASGKQLHVNAEKHRTFEQLTEDERRRVAKASQWKDLNRVSDRSQSTLGNLGSLPPASHVKQHEKHLNDQLEEILTVLSVVFLVATVIVIVIAVVVVVVAVVVVVVVVVCHIY